MAQPAQTPFAVDSDITPLQGRFFNSVTANISDPNLRSQLYDKVRSTFGGIQQARDIQRTKAQEEEERSVALELRRAQLDQSKLELGLARDKVRQQQDAVAKTGEFNSVFDDFVNYELEGLSPEEANTKLGLLGSQYADVLVYNPAAKAKLDLTAGALRKPKDQLRGFTAGFVKGLVGLGDEAASRLVPNITSDPRYIVSKSTEAQRQALAANIASSTAAERLADKANKSLNDVIDKGTTPNWSQIDSSLKELDKLNFITKEQKEQLAAYGINPLATPQEIAAAAAKTKDEREREKRQAEESGTALPNSKIKTRDEAFKVLQDIYSDVATRAIGAKAVSSSNPLLAPQTDEDVADNPLMYGTPPTE